MRKRIGIISSVALGIFAIQLAGCGGGPCGIPDNTLQGSVEEDLQVDAVRARYSMSQDTVVIDFKRSNDSNAKVVANVETFARGARIPLTDGDVFRVTSPDTQFPRDIVRGEVVITSELTTGEEFAGCFNVLFQSTDGTQRTLEGAFRTVLEEGL